MKRKWIWLGIIILLGGAAITMSILSKGMQNTYEAEARSQFAARGAQQTELLTEADMAHLPAPVQKYLRYTGAVGKPKVHNFRAEFRGRMKQDPKRDWMQVSARQVNFYPNPVRLFYIDGRFSGIPAYGLHAYKEQKGTMRIKLAGLLTVVDAKGHEMDQSDTVTLFNDMCVMAPATLIDSNIQWETVDDRTVKAVYPNGENRVSAVLTFNDAGELINFVSEDRFMKAGDKDARLAPWSTPLTDYQDYNGLRLASRAKAVWLLPEGEYLYAEFEMVNVEQNVGSLK